MKYDLFADVDLIKVETDDDSLASSTQKHTGHADLATLNSELITVKCNVLGRLQYDNNAGMPSRLK